MTCKIIGIKEAIAPFQEIRDFINSTKPMQGIVNDIKTDIQMKTAGGQDYMGRNFAPYSAAYAKKKKGRTASGRPNLKLTGTMMDALTAVVISPKYGRVYVRPDPEPGKANAEMLAQIHTTGSGKQPKREFMNEPDNRIRVLVKKHYDDPIGELAKARRIR